MGHNHRLSKKFSTGQPELVGSRAFMTLSLLSGDGDYFPVALKALIPSPAAGL
jgi:hypothetical protein